MAPRLRARFVELAVRIKESSGQPEENEPEADEKVPTSLRRRYEYRKPRAPDAAEDERFHETQAYGRIRLQR